ncbi:MAG TPA: YidC/Oxa1 family membrane protein insertase [Acidimicrobiales bacterium]|nr:YidC/Oxa1 family membrane protein insertase [Acidimicrobiales bacterium]
MLLASSLGKIVHPLFIAFAWLLALFYSWIPNYAVAIMLLTLTVMIVVFPITRKGTRSMMKMQILAPEMKKLQARYKAPAGASAAERTEARQKLNEEMMALYKENGVSPTGGCVPMFLQFPAFIILYDTIRGLTHLNAAHHLAPLYVAHTTRMYHDIVTQNALQVRPHLDAFGLNLADSVRTSGLSFAARIPFLVLILVAIALQYVQMKQLSGRNPAAAQANPQMQQMQKVMPLIFAVIYISIPAGVNVYFIISSLFRIAQQEFMYKRDPQILASMEHLRARTKQDPKVVEAKLAIERERRPKGVLGRLLPSPAFEGDGDVSGGSAKPARPNGGNGGGGAATGGGRGGGGATKSGQSGRGPQRSGARGARNGRPSANAAQNGSAPAPKTQPRAQGKRRRRPR